MEADLYLNLAGVLVCQCEMFCNFREACLDSIAQDTYPLNTFTLPPAGAATKMATDVELKLVESSFVYNL